MIFRVMLAGLLLGLVGCSMTPSTHIHQPLTARPVDRKVVVPADGAIFHAGINEHLLFEDKRARNVGDTLIVYIAENTSGSRKSSGATSSASNLNANLPTVTGGPLAQLAKAFPLTSSSSSKSATTGAGAASEDLTGTIAVTVTEVLSNGNLVIGGEEQVSLNNSDEYIRFSGVINPTSISNANTVSSTQVADAHIEYKNAGAMSEVINDAKSLGFLGRFFQSVLPF